MGAFSCSHDGPLPSGPSLFWVALRIPALIFSSIETGGLADDSQDLWQRFHDAVHEWLETECPTVLLGI